MFGREEGGGGDWGSKSRNMGQANSRGDLNIFCCTVTMQIVLNSQLVYLQPQAATSHNV